MCRRTTFDDLRNRPSYLSALNLAARTPGLKGLKTVAGDEDAEDESMQRVKEEEMQRRAAAAAGELFGSANGTVSGPEMTQEEWNTVIGAMKILNRFSVDGLVSTKRGEVFSVPPKFPLTGDANWDVEASSSLHAWLTEGQVVKTSLTLPPVSAGKTLTAPATAALEASLARSWPGRPGVQLPRGPLDIFHPSSINQAVKAE